MHDATATHDLLTPTVDAQRPWPGLSAYTEEFQGYFYGRQQEADDLAHRLQRKLLTVLFGQSGLGKTSLLQAGLFPILRREEYLPVLIRLDYAPAAPDLVAQVKAAICRALLGAQGPESVPPEAEETLWEYFHRQPPAAERPAAPRLVLVFDQFEELFTLGFGHRESRVRLAPALVELADLIENRAPAALKERFERDASLVENFAFDRQDCRVLFCLREDHLPHLEELRGRMPSIAQNRMRLTALRGPQALDAVLRPGGALVAPEVAAEIVRFVAASRTQRFLGEAVPLQPPADDDLAALEVDPALLSLFCRELNERRIAGRLPQITSGLLATSSNSILLDFYQRCVADQPPGVRVFVEEELLTDSGYRDNIPLERAEKALAAREAPASAVGELVQRRLLRLEERLQVQRVELTHDVLAPIVQKSRDDRRRQEAILRADHEALLLAETHARQQAELARQQAERNRRLRQWIVAVAVALVLVAGLAAFSIVQWRRASQSRLEAEESRYAADMRLAQLALSSGDISRAANLLDQFQNVGNGVDYRGFEWPFLRWLCAGDSRATYHGFRDQAWCVAFSPDGTVLAAGGQDATVHVFDVATRRPIADFRLPGNGVLRVRFTPDGQTLACTTGNWQHGMQPGKLYFCDWRLGRVRAELGGHTDAVNGVAFAPDGKHLATCGEDMAIILWTITGPSAATPGTPFKGHIGGQNDVAFSGDARYLASGSGDGYLQVWDVESQRKLIDRRADVSGIMTLAFAPDHRTLLLGTRDGRVASWDVPSEREIGKFDTGQGEVNSLALSRDGQQLVTGGGDSTIAVWNLADPRPGAHPVARLGGHHGRVLCVAYSPAGPVLASGSDDNTLKLWDVYQRREVPTLHYDAAVSSLAFSRDGRLLAVAGGALAAQSEAAQPAAMKTIRVWTLGSEQPPVVLEGHRDVIAGLAFAPDGRTLASGSHDGTAALWDVPTQRCKARWQADATSVYAVGFTPDGGLLATGGLDGVTRLWDPAGQPAEPQATLQAHEGTVRALAFTRDGRLLATGSADRSVRVWDLAARRCLNVLDGAEDAAEEGAGPQGPRAKGAFAAVAFSPNGRLLVGGNNDLSIRFWVASDGTHFDKLARRFPCKAAISSLAFSPDGKTLAAGCRDASVILWNVATKEDVVTFTEHGGSVSCVAFSPDGSILATGSFDHTVKLWGLSPPHSQDPADTTNQWTVP